MNDATTLRTKRRENFINALGTECVSVPSRSNTGPADLHRGICKIRFSNAVTYLHPAPDPLLLIARACVILSVRQGYRLRAYPVAQDNYGEDEWEQDVLQLEFMAELQRERQLREVVAGLEINVDRSGLQDSDNDTLSVSSAGSQEGQEDLGER